MVWRARNRTTQKYHIYKVSFKCKQLISRMYRVMLGEEDIPESIRFNHIMKKDEFIAKWDNAKQTVGGAAVLSVLAIIQTSI